VDSVATAQAVTMTASAGSVFKSFPLQLSAAILALSINATSVAFGDVVVNTPATQSVTLTSTGTVAVTINGAALTGAAFTLSGAAFPATLNPGQQAMLYIQFNPLAVGAAAGQLAITSNASTNSTAVIDLTGTGTAPPVVAVAVTPTIASATTGATQQFAATVTGSPGTAVTWTVSGTGCSGIACGTISSSGLYTAPVAVPSSASVTITAASQSDPTKSASATITIVPSTGTTYYLAPTTAGGSDSNNGTSPTMPWASPNHALNCGDVILAASGNYGQLGEFGNVTCPAGNSVAWLKCAKFGSCKISGSFTYSAIYVNASYWGVQGWEVTASGSGGSCFTAQPNNGASIHHIIFANNIANGCTGGGIQAQSNGKISVDYLAFVGNIAYNSTSGSGACTSGINVFEPINYDTLPGTHIYIAGNFSWDNVDGKPCNGGAPTDGEGVNFDTWNGLAFTGQGVVTNNILIFNGGPGLITSGAGNNYAKIYWEYNTLYGNHKDSALPSCTVSGDLQFLYTSLAEAAYNIVATSAATGCANNAAYYALSVANSDGTDQVHDNFAYGLNGQNSVIYNSGTFSYGPNNTLGISPAFANPVDSGAPSCGSYANVPACMATVIANFTPTNAAAAGYGYQVPSSTPIYDPLFPKWLCNVNLPSGLVTMGCQTGP
jgi:hypothetical protein